MKKKKRRSSFAKRLTRRVLLTLFVVMSGVSYLVYQIALEVLEEEEEQRYEVMLDWEAEYVRRSLSHVRMAALNTVYAFEMTLDRPDQIQALVERIVRDNKSIRSCGLSFVDSYYPQKGRLFMPYAERRGDSVVGRDRNHSVSNYLEEEWFSEAIKGDSGVWSKPFMGGSNGQTPLIAYLLPIHDKSGRVAAVLGADFSLDMLREKLRKADQKARISADDSSSIFFAYSFIIDREGTYLAHPDSTLILNENILEHAKAQADTTLLHVVRQMIGGKKGIMDETEDGEDVEINDRASHIFYTPVKNCGLSIGIVVPNLSLKIFGYVLGVFLLFFIFVGLVVVFVAIKFGIRRMVRPLNRLTVSAEEVAKGNFETSLPKIKHYDEVGMLRDSFENMQRSLVKYIDELTETTKQKASIESELTIAHRIQMSMLPKVFPPYPERNDIDIYGELTPAKAVGGDLFDFYIRDERLFFCIGDVAGKGIPASLVMVVTRSLFRNISSHLTHPGHIVETLNDALSDSNDSNMFVTLFVGVLNLATGHLDYCNAGHDAPVLIGYQGLGLLPCEANLPVGVMPGWKFKSQKALIDPHTTIFLYTDGLTEAENIDHDLFGEQRMLNELTPLREADTYKPEQVISHITLAIHDFVGEAEQSDDLTMLAIQYNVDS